jgi:hypothetical protein
MLKRGKEIIRLGEHNVMIPAARVGGMSCSVPTFASRPLISGQAFDSVFGGSLLHEGTMIKRTKVPDRLVGAVLTEPSPWRSVLACRAHQ